MKFKKLIAWFLVCIMMFSLTETNIGSIRTVHATDIEETDDITDTETDNDTGNDTDDENEDDTDDDTDNENDDDTEDDTDNENDDDTENDTDDENDDDDTDTDNDTEQPVAGVISNAIARYDEATATITISYTKTGCEYVDIIISSGDNQLTKVEEYSLNSYVYQVTEFGKSYSFTIIPYDNADEPEPAESAAITVTYDVPNNDSLLQALWASYDMETNILQIDWVGTNIASADIYQDGTKIATVTNSNSYRTEVVLEEAKTYQYKVTAFNSDSTQSESKTYNLTTGRYPACLSNVDAVYNEETKQIELTWDSTYTTSVDIFINDEEAITGYKGSECNIDYRIQPGAQYTISITPYNIIGEEGDTVNVTLSDGEFTIPDAPDLEVQSHPILNKKKAPTGFYRPAIDVIMSVQPGATYEIYRATSDKKSAYNWIATITAGDEDTYTYRDTNVGIKTYYYKVLRKIAEDDYILDETYTGLSDSSEIEIEIPEPEITGDLLEDGSIEIVLSADSDFVSGYVIYRKAGNGKYEAIATISSNTYKDSNISFDTRYSYKAKAYYYDTKTKKKTYGTYSSVFNVRNTIGGITIDVTPLSGNQVKISWSKAGNAAGYEVYYKTNTIGDSYERLTSTKKLSVKKKLNSKKVYSFLVKAYRKSSKGKTYFSEATITYTTKFAKPTGLTVTKTSHTIHQGTLQQQTSLKWNRVYNAQGYYIQSLDVTTGEYKTVTKIRGGNATSCTVTNVLPASISDTDLPATITYRVVAFKGNSTIASEPIEVTLQLATPLNVKAKTKGSNVRISWKKVASAEKYRVYRTCGRGMVLLGETSTLSMTDTNIETGVKYTYYIQAINQTLGYESDYSEATEYTRKPSPVKKVNATNKWGRKVVLKWNKVKNVDSYVIYYSTQKNGTYKKLATLKSNVLQYTHTNLVKGRTYYYKITTKKNNSSGACVESKPATTSITVVR